MLKILFRTFFNFLIAKKAHFHRFARGANESFYATDVNKPFLAASPGNTYF